MLISPGPKFLSSHRHHRPFELTHHIQGFTPKCVLRETGVGSVLPVHRTWGLDGTRSPKKSWDLTRTAFDLLLARLDPDPDEAAKRYEHLQESLITFFEYHNCNSPEDLVDDTMNRVARNLSEGKEIYSNNPASYFYGVARNVLRQWWEEKGKEPLALDDVMANRLTVAEGESLRLERERFENELRLSCLSSCLAKLPDINRGMILRYYEGETSVKIVNRKLLAENLGISVKSLRVRALRVREKLERCVSECANSTTN